ncbi:MAG: sugar phosphate isomerase/epimerase family protein [Rariglobus sp.]|nr:sugar phosphate isomerase/epimerase [Rariglobus sp.]
MKKIPLSLQLWSVHQETKRDFAATVAEVARIGYTGVELAGYGNLDAAGAKAALDAAGLKVSGMHVGFQRLRDDLAGVINDALLFGTRHVVCPHWPETQFISAAACAKIGEQLAGWGSTLRAFGLQLGFHNHAIETTVIEGRTALDWMLGAAAPRDLGMEPDVYWLTVGGLSSEKFLRDYGARVQLVHLKDETELGSGPVNFAPIFAAIDEIGSVEWLVVEQESYNHAPLVSVRLCFEKLKSWGR